MVVLLDEAIGGLLHDAVEDQGGLKTLIKIRKLFGNKVAKIVNECSDTLQGDHRLYNYIIVPQPPWLLERKNIFRYQKERSIIYVCFSL
ncbi:hypothetical protein ABXT46_04235 [Candidatus Pelagibacter sp. Uisw_104]|uniref:hypothetical protein n=1 Tax=Candidatus Pelagibacter sp. Uisw_104 TaxID=3230983 RepID=UPI0039E91462